MSDTEIPLTGGGRTSVSRVGDVVHRETGPWAQSVHALLRHLDAEGLPARRASSTPASTTRASRP